MQRRRKSRLFVGSFYICPEDFATELFSGQSSWVHDYVLKENSFFLQHLTESQLITASQRDFSKDFTNKPPYRLTSSLPELTQSLLLLYMIKVHNYNTVFYTFYN